MARVGVAVRGLLLQKSLLVRVIPCRGLRMTPFHQQQEKRSAVDTYKTLKLEQMWKKVLHVELNQPEKRNVMNAAFWREMVECFNKISQDSECHAMMISGAGKFFTSGIDLMEMGSIFVLVGEEDTAHKAWNIHRKIREYRENFTMLEKCPKPVIAAIHGSCIGGGISVCNIRNCTQDAWFQVKEVDIGMVADMGVLQRLPYIIGNHCLMNELAFTAQKMMAAEAKSSGLVSRMFQDKEAIMESVFDLAVEIASKSHVALQGSKVNLVYSRDHPEGLKYMATWNMSMLQTEDIVKSAQAAMEKKTPKQITYFKL